MTSEPKRIRARPPRPKLDDVDALEALWRQHGDKAIRHLAEHDPSAYIMAMARLVADLDDED